MQNQHGGVVRIDGYVYGYRDSILSVSSSRREEVVWRHRSLDKGSLLVSYMSWVKT